MYKRHHKCGQRAIATDVLSVCFMCKKYHSCILPHTDTPEEKL